MQTELRALLRVVAIAALAGICAAWLAARNQLAPPYVSLDDRHVVVRAVALERPRLLDAGLSMRVRVIGVISPRVAAARSLVGRVAALDVPAVQAVDGVAGRELTARARLELPAGPRNDGERAQRDILADEGVSFSMRAHAARDIHVGDKVQSVEAWLARVRERCAIAVESRLAPLHAAVLEGILWGDRANLPAELRQEFSDTGTVHVLVTAGLHLGMMAALIAALMSLVPIPRTARVCVVVGAAWAYATLAGLHVPTLRAASMLTAGALALECGRVRTTSAVLAAAAFAVCLPHPLALLSPAFAMSFACVGGIALLAPALGELGLRGDGANRLPAELLRTSLAVQLAMWPYQALYFNAMTPYAVLANVLVVPLVGLVMACGTALVACALLFPPLAVPTANLTSWLLTFMVGIVERIARLPFAHVDVPPPNTMFFVLYWLALAAFAVLVARNATPKRLAAIGFLAAAILAITYAAPGIRAALDPRVHVDAIDVGQADCLLVRAPGMHAMLIDGGGRLERTAAGMVVAQPIGDRIAARTVMPFLLRHWVLHLDAVVLTHPHGDHAGGLPVVLARERVGAVFDSAQAYGGPAYQHALDVIRERRIAWRQAVRGESFDLGSLVRVRILAPELPLIIGTTSDINNNSVVARIEFRHVAMLMTGDAQAEAEARLLSHGGADLRADVLKVGHHGSAYSSTRRFLEAVRPKVAVISCGLHNVFGHPSRATLAALRSIGAVTYRTDTEGGVHIVTDGERISVTTTR